LTVRPVRAFHRDTPFSGNAMLTEEQIRQRFIAKVPEERAALAEAL
jgi:hypothetical protein